MGDVTPVLRRWRESLIVRRANRRGYIESRHATPRLLLLLKGHVAMRLTEQQAASVREIELRAARDQRDHWKRLFNRLDAAITHHRRDCEKNDVPDTHDEALWAARDRVLRDAS